MHRSIYLLRKLQKLQMPILKICRTCFFVDLECPVSAPDNGFRDGDPGVVVAENAGIFFVSRRIGGNLAELDMIPCVGGLQDHNAVFGIQILLHGVESPDGLAALHADAGQDAEALRP